MEERSRVPDYHQEGMHLLRRVIRYGPFVVMCAVIAGAAAYVIARRQVTYTTSATAAISPNDAATQLIQGSTYTPTVDTAAYVSSQVPYLTSDAVLRVADRLVHGQTGHRLATVAASGDTTAQTLTVTAKSSDRNVAVASANDVLRAYGEVSAGARRRLVESAIASLGRRLTELKATMDSLQNSTQKADLTALRTASGAYTQAAETRQTLLAESQVPQAGYASITAASHRTAHPSATDKLALLGLLLGAILGTLVAVLREQSVGTIRSAAEVAKSAQVAILAQLPNVSRRNRGMGGRAYSTDSGFAEGLRRLRVNLRLQMVSHPQSIVLMSPGRREGRSFVAANLATSWALSGRSVLLVSSDLRRSDIGRFVGEDDAEEGFTNILALAGKESLSDADLSGQIHRVARPTSVPNLSFLPTGTVSDHPENLMELDELERVMQALARHWELVIFDSAPLLAHGEGAILARHADATVLLATVNLTTRTHLRLAYDVLLTNGVTNIFTAVNKDSGPPATFTDPEAQLAPERNSVASSTSS